MPKFKFKSNKKKNRFNFITDNDEILNQKIVTGAHTEIFSNKKIILEGCVSILDYRNDYIKLKLNKGILIIMGTDFIIPSFEGENIVIKGNIISVEFSI